MQDDIGRALDPGQCHATSTNGIDGVVLPIKEHNVLSKILHPFTEFPG